MNGQLGVIPKDVADAIDDAADGGGRAASYDDHFPIDVFQTGSGTSSNMNINEVLARAGVRTARRRRAPERPRERLAVIQRRVPVGDPPRRDRSVVRDLIPALEHLATALRRQSGEFATVVKAGRTHLMDATPVTLGQEFGGYAAPVEHGVERLAGGAAARRRAARSAAPRSAPASTARAGSPQRVIARLATDTGLPLTEARDHFEAQGARDALVEASGVLPRDRGVASTRSPTTCAGWAAGPNAGSPRSASPTCSRARRSCRARSTRSSAEAVQQVVAQVIGNDAAVAWSRGDGQLRAQRDAAGDRPQPAGVDPTAGRRVAGVRRQVHRTASRPTRNGATATRRRRRRSSRR